MDWFTIFLSILGWGVLAYFYWDYKTDKKAVLLKREAKKQSAEIKKQKYEEAQKRTYNVGKSVIHLIFEDKSEEPVLKTIYGKVFSTGNIYTSEERAENYIDSSMKKQSFKINNSLFVLSDKVKNIEVKTESFFVDITNNPVAQKETEDGPYRSRLSEEVVI